MGLGTRRRSRRPRRGGAPRAAPSASLLVSACWPSVAELVSAASDLETFGATRGLILHLCRGKLARMPRTWSRRSTPPSALGNTLLRPASEFGGGILRLCASRMSMAATDGSCGSLLPRGGLRTAFSPSLEFGGEPPRLGQGRLECKLAGSSLPNCATRECRAAPRLRLRAIRRLRGRGRRRRLDRAEAALPPTCSWRHGLSC